MNKCISLTLLLLVAACSQPAEHAPTETHDESSGSPDVMAIHQAALVLDAHADIEIPGAETRYAGDDGLSQVAPDKMQAGGVDAVVMAIAVGPGPRDAAGYAEAQARAQAELAAIEGIVADNNLVLARSPDELLAAHAAGQGALILGLQNARILANEVDAIDQYFASGVRVFALTHMGHNNFADSSRPVFLGELGHHEPDAEHGGLSDLGRQAISRVNALGGVVDISQLSKQAALQVMSLSTAPVIASHSNVRALTDVRRNLTDEEIDRVGETGGVIHVAAFKGYLFDSTDVEMDAAIRAARAQAGIIEDYDYPFELYWEIDDPQVQQTYLSTVSDIIGPGSVDAMLNHLDYIVQRIGVDHVGIGNDFNHGSGIDGYQDASEAANITRGLLQRGYSAADINKIWGGNFVRVWQAAEAARTTPQ